MIKKILLSLFLFVGLGIGYTFGYGTYVEFGDPITQFGGNECTIGNNLAFNCTKAGLSLSSYDSGYDKVVTSFFWTDEGLGFYYKHTNNNTFTKQGIINTGFYICSGDTSSINVGSSIMGGSCNNGFTKVSIGSYEDFIQFLKGKTPRLVGSGYPSIYPILFELVYDNFYFSIQLSPSNNNFRVLGVDNFIIQDMGVSGTEYNLSFSNIVKSPYGGSNNRGSNTNNNIYCPTIGQLMQIMGENYNTGLCYNNTTYFNGTNFEQIEKQDIFTIFNDDYQNYTNRISTYRNNCNNYVNTTQACQNAFSGEYKKYSIISNAINSNVDEKKLRNYCNYGLNYDTNATTCVASGIIKEPYTNEEIIDYIINDGIIVTPGKNETGNNNVLNAINKCENGDRDCYVNNRNFIESLGNIYGKITGLFKERNGVNGIIPEYILRITFMTILFTVIFKK